ncbi:unnamed protein product, partial [Nesidiocoris tenuis]
MERVAGRLRRRDTWLRVGHLPTTGDQLFGKEPPPIGLPWDEVAEENHAPGCQDVSIAD